MKSPSALVFAAVLPVVEEAIFGTFTQDLERLRQESTGVYRIPVWNVLKRGKRKFELTLVNPATVRALQGRKTDRTTSIKCGAPHC